MSVTTQGRYTIGSEGDKHIMQFKSLRKHKQSQAPFEDPDHSVVVHIPFSRK